MLRYLSQSLFLLLSLVIIICIIYPLALWSVGQTLFPFQANGSILFGPNGKAVGSKLIAQPFTEDQYFWPRPSAASYNASASASSALAASNYVLRDRVARALGPIVKYQNGQPVAPDIEKWFQQDSYQRQPHIVAQWATLHNSLAQTWVTSDPTHVVYVNNWVKTHPEIMTQYIKANPNNLSPQAADLAVLFFQNFSLENPGKFPLSSGSDIQSIFFDMWRQDHPDIQLQDIPSDMVTTSASGLDPDISLQNANYQLDRVANKWAEILHRNPDSIKNEIQKILLDNAQAPFNGLTGEKFVNVLEVNLAMIKQYRTSGN